jgi:hypothetical protein
MSQLIFQKASPKKPKNVMVDSQDTIMKVKPYRCESQRSSKKSYNHLIGRATFVHEVKPTSSGNVTFFKSPTPDSV